MNTRPVIEDGKHDPHTGWFCYYVYGKGGCGYYTPNYVYAPDCITMEGNSIAEHFVAEYESEFFSWASAPVLEVFSNVVPPKEEILKLIEHERTIIANAEQRIVEYVNAQCKLMLDT